MSAPPCDWTALRLYTWLKMVSVICTLEQHTDEVSGCAFSGSLLATCFADKTLRVSSTIDFSELPFSRLSGHGYGVHCCCFHFLRRLPAQLLHRWRCCCVELGYKWAGRLVGAPAPQSGPRLRSGSRLIPRSCRGPWRHRGALELLQQDITKVNLSREEICKLTIVLQMVFVICHYKI